MKSKTVVPKIRRLSLPADIGVSQRRQVNAYLREHPDLHPIVLAMCRRARAEFGSEAELTLQMNQDREVRDPYLILYVRLPAYVAATREQIDDIWQRFEDELCPLLGWIIMTTDFRKVTANTV